MAQRYSFRDPITGRLKTHGFVESNREGDVRRPEPEEFSLDPVKGYQWNGVAWILVGPEPKPKAVQIAAIKNKLQTDASVSDLKVTLIRIIDGLLS